MRDGWTFLPVDPTLTLADAVAEIIGRHSDWKAEPDLSVHLVDDTDLWCVFCKQTVTPDEAPWRLSAPVPAGAVVTEATVQTYPGGPGVLRHVRVKFTVAGVMVAPPVIHRFFMRKSAAGEGEG